MDYLLTIYKGEIISLEAKQRINDKDYATLFL